MRRVMGVVVVAIVLLVAPLSWAASVFDVMESIQERITWQVWNANGWAASPIVVDAVLAQNQKGPIAGMDNEKWKAVPESDPLVKGFVDNETGKFLQAEIAKTDGVCVGAFLNAAQGEKVAFTKKTASYVHKGSEKFDVPYATGKLWQGKPEREGKIYVIQISVPVLSDKKPIGALVVEIDGSKLESLVTK